MEAYSEWLAVAEDLAKTAAAAVLGFMDGPVAIQEKTDHSPVTEADLTSDQILRTGLAKQFPGHAILTEENGLSGNPASQFIWVIDPLDGTKAFAKGIPGFCVMVGLLKVGRPQLGLIIDPLEGRCYRGIRGQGASHTQYGKTEALQVSTRENLSEMPWVVSTGFPETALERAKGMLPGPLLSPINSVGIKVGLLVRQAADIYLNHHPVSYWDTAAPALILEEAGGSFTALDGSPLDYTLRKPFGHGVKTLASNGPLHGVLAASLTRVFV